MTPVGLARGRAVMTLAVLAGVLSPGEPRRIHRAGVQRLKPRTAKSGRGQNECKGERAGTPEEPDHRCLK